MNASIPYHSTCLRAAVRSHLHAVYPQWREHHSVSIAVAHLTLFGLMTTRLVLLFFCVLAVSTDAASTDDKVKWQFDRKANVWVSPETGITLRKSIASFQQKSAEPYDKDGSTFSYWGKHGVLDLFIEHRVAGGYPGSGDCTPQVRANYLQLMHEKYGRTNSERPFKLVYRSGGKSARGLGTVCHFVSFPTFGGMPAYSEVGVVLIGDILLEYRYSFLNPAGEADLNAFLQALGMKKV